MVNIIARILSIVKTCHNKDIPVFWTQHGHRNLSNDGGLLREWVYNIY